MKKIIALFSMMVFCSVGVMAQKYALIDMEYIFRNIPSYEKMNEELGQLSEKWQAEVELLQDQAQAMYKAYQNDLALLSAEARSKREEQIIQKEQEAQELKQTYFGADGELYKKRDALMGPLQDTLYNAVKEVAESGGYSVVVDRASAMSIIYASPSIDISNEVLAKMGYSK